MKVEKSLLNYALRKYAEGLIFGSLIAYPMSGDFTNIYRTSIFYGSFFLGTEISKRWGQRETDESVLRRMRRNIEEFGWGQGTEINRRIYL